VFYQEEALGIRHWGLDIKMSKIVVNSYKDLIIWQRGMDMVEVCTRLKYLQQPDSNQLLAEIVEISKMISSLISKNH